ncbi:hypothetical protein LR48_Vigan10g130800 [Vigna angularis]|uniref:Calcineurin-like phosphoesterase domain-containing protein n=1 Tax=Phaseolus angularis TaxID=3914 RepID=A0A0L9VK40_PHAAN|nr:hypothetical protein LR48_Vigan10g130800 [Vigna angularis]
MVVKEEEEGHHPQKVEVYYLTSASLFFLEASYIHHETVGPDATPVTTSIMTGVLSLAFLLSISCRNLVAPLRMCRGCAEEQHKWQRLRLGSDCNRGSKLNLKKLSVDLHYSRGNVAVLWASVSESAERQLETANLKRKLDRGGDELKIFYFLEKLKREAARSGGRIITIHGNHEIMNVEGDFRFATEFGIEEFRVWWEWFQVGNKIKSCHGLEKPNDPMRGVPSSFRGVRKEFHDGFVEGVW